MIRIQKLKEPKITSGEELPPEGSMVFRGVKLKNTTRHTLYVDWYVRKPWIKKDKKRRAKNN